MNSVSETIFLPFFLVLAILPINAGHDIGLGNLAEIFTQLAGGDGCIFNCPKGLEPKEDKKHIPTSNGCGSYGINFATGHEGFEDCCNEHDKCYDTCNRNKERCDKRFEKCLLRACEFEGIHKEIKNKKGFIKKCKSKADLMYAGTLGLGCPAFKEAQRNACLCNGKKISKRQMRTMEKLEEL